MVNKVTSPGDTVLVIGGCGFVGSHLVRLLAERGENIAEVRVLDLREKSTIQVPSTAFVDDNRNSNFPYNINSSSVSVKYIQGDILKLSDLRRAAEGCTVIFHLASIICTTLDDPKSEEYIHAHAVNVTGTGNVIKVCKELNIEHLVYCSTTEIKRNMAARDRYSEEEIDKDRGDHASLALPGYSITKYQAEKQVLEANGSRMRDGKTLKTLSLRPCGIYGEGDDTLITRLMHVCKDSMGILPILGSKSTQMQKVYVGNVAWAHVQAFNQMRHKAEVCGHAYNVVDSTSVVNLYTWATPFLESHNMKVVPIAIPTLLIFYLVMLAEALLFLISPLFNISIPCTSSEVYLSCVNTTYSGSKAGKKLGFHPLFSAQEAYRRSYEYYEKVDLKSLRKVKSG